MALLKIVDNQLGRPVGTFNWFPTHGTSMSRDNKLISGDNKGAAARFMEDWFWQITSASNHSAIPSSRHSKRNMSNTASQLLGLHSSTGGRPCTRLSSTNYRVRSSTRRPTFVAAFCQSNVGDVSPNILGAFCSDTGLPCDFNHSTCNGNNQLCIGRGPGYPDEITSTEIIGNRQFKRAVDLFNSAKEQLSGKVDYRHVYLNFTRLKVSLTGNQQKEARTCPAALGPGFAAGTTDGPGAFGFTQGDTEINPFWALVRDLLKEPTKEQIECHKPKPILLDTGEMLEPYAWAPAILPIQILRIGQFIILCVPGEFTTMAGRRLRKAVKETLIANGNGEYNNGTHIVIAGLTNTYSQYVATFEEYQEQRYEGASTLYGPHTLSAYIQEFQKLAKALAMEVPISDEGPPPPDLSSKQISLLPPVFGDRIPPGVTFGDVKQDVQPKKTSYNAGDVVSASFWSANPRNDLLTEGTFSVVEHLDAATGKWNPAFDDDDFSLLFMWDTQNGTSYSYATIQWKIPSTIVSGIYRMRHFGAAQQFLESVQYFTGTSSPFHVAP